MALKIYFGEIEAAIDTFSYINGKTLTPHPFLSPFVSLTIIADRKRYLKRSLPRSRSYFFLSP